MSHTIRLGPGSAGAPLPLIIRAVRRLGWGELTGADLRGVCGVLEVLCSIVDPRSGTGTTTAEAIAVQARYSEGWTRSRLHVLEELGIVTWTRGGIIEGRPQPSFFRIAKQALCDLLPGARDRRDADLEARRGEFRARLARLRTLNVRSKGRKRRSDHPIVTGTLPPYGGPPAAVRGADGTEIDPIAQTMVNQAGVQAVRQALVASRYPETG